MRIDAISAVFKHIHWTLFSLFIRVNFNDQVVDTKYEIEKIELDFVKNST